MERNGLEWRGLERTGKDWTGEACNGYKKEGKNMIRNDLLNRVVQDHEAPGQPDTFIPLVRTKKYCKQLSPKGESF